MAAILVKTFGGLKPILSPQLLGINEAQTANNVRLISGAIAPLRSTNVLMASVLPVPRTIFRYGNSAVETEHWLEFGQDTDIMRSPIANDQYDRLYWTDGENQPRYAPNSLILTGNPKPGASYLLGIPAPSTAPVMTAFSTVPVYTVLAREYVLTLYNPTTNKESVPSAVFSVQGVDGQKVTLTNLSTDNRGDAGVTKKRLYRKVSGTFRLVAELDLATTTYEDTTLDSALGSAATVTSTSASVPTPTKAVVATAASSSASAAKSYQYVYTITGFSITSGGETEVTTYYAESGPSDAVTISADSTQTVTLSGFVNNLAGSNYKIYRKDPGSSQFLFVGQIPAGINTFQDPVGTSTLGTPLQYDAPASYKPTNAATASKNTSTYQAPTQRVYMVTFVDGSGNESGKGPVSNVVSVVDGVTAVSLTHSEAVPAGVTKKRIYRQTVTSTNGVVNINDANWRRLSEVTASTTTGSDSAAESTLTTGLSSSLQNLPPSPTGSPTINAVIPPKKIPEARTYVITFVSAYGEEGPPSPASSVTEVDPELPVTVSIQGSPTGNYNITLKRIYRSSTVGNQAQFQFVAEVPLATSSYTDSKKQSELGEILLTEDWVAPPAGLKGLRLLANGAAVGFKGKTVYFSEPNLPHAWPHEYAIDYDIVGIAVFGQTVAVMTTHYPYLFQGIDPAAMASTRLPNPQACASKRSIVETGDGVFYASPDGMVGLSANSMNVITQGVYSRDQWQAFKPSSMECYLYNGRVVIFYKDASNVRGTLLMDVSGQGALLTTASINAAADVNAGYYDPGRDTLYLAQSGNIVRFDAGDNLTYTWKSKLFRLEYPSNFSFGQVRSSTYPVTMKVYADGQLRLTKTVANANQFRMPSGFRAYDWELQVEGTGIVTEFGIAQSSVELKSA